MDKANLALAEYVAEKGTPVHLVAHVIDPEVTKNPLITAEVVPRPLGSIFLGSTLLDRRGRQAARMMRRRFGKVRTVVNGSSSLLGDVNWSHYVHSAWKPPLENRPLAYRMKTELLHWIECSRERKAYRIGKLVITNSDLTKVHVQALLENEQEKVRTIYLGCDTEWNPISAEERAESRRKWNLPEDRKVVVFVGAIGFDHRKGFDILFEAWKTLCSESGWQEILVVAGEGGALAYWQEQAAKAGLSDRIRFLGFCKEVTALLAAADLMISPVRYEPYGLNLQEALCRGLPVITTPGTGMAERFPPSLRPLLMTSADAVSCVEKLRLWRTDVEGWKNAFHGFGSTLSRRSWRKMAEEMTDLINSADSQPAANG